MFHRSRKPAAPDPGAAQIRVHVDGGFHPDTIRAVVGRPLRLTFRREDGSPCSERVVFPALGESRTLPVGTDVAIDIVPEAPGDLEFTCAMGMLRGRLVVEAPDPVATAAA